MKRYECLVGIIFCLCIVVVCGQDFIKAPKIKKVYVSCQQYAEAEGDSVTKMNSIWQLSADINKKFSIVQQRSLRMINSYIDGDKNCFLQQADKVERTNKHTKLMEFNRECDCWIEDFKIIDQYLDTYIAG